MGQAAAAERDAQVDGTPDEPSPVFGAAQRVVESAVIAVATSTGLYLVGSVYTDAYYGRMSIEVTSLDLSPPFIALQSEYNMLKRGVEREVLPYCRAHQVGFVPYYPLAGGFLTGKYEIGKTPPPGSRGESTRNVQELMVERNYQTVARLSAWAKDHGRGVNELAEAWLLAQPQICSVITGARNLEQLTSNVKAADWELTKDELGELETLLKP